MRVAHLSDIHYCDKYLDEVDRCMGAAVEYLQANRPDAIVLSGDTFDHRLEQSSPAFLACLERVCQLGHIAPVLILQGTLSHDAPNAVRVFRHLHTAYPVHVADRIEQVYLSQSRSWTASEGWTFGPDWIPPPYEQGALFSCLPSVNKGMVAAAVGAENAAHEAGNAVAALLKSWAPIHQQARTLGLPTVVVSHGTVNGSVTEHGVMMAGPDHEFTVGALAASCADAVLLGHVHKHQAWEHEGCVIAYAGSLGRLHFGEMDAKGFLVWTIDAQGATAEFIETPARRLVDLEFPGAPDLAEVARIAATLPPGCHVRLRYSLDEEHRASVDRDALAAMFATAAAVKVEGRIAPVSRQRAAGISQAPSLTEQLRAWCALTQTDAEPLVTRLEALRSQSIQQITEALT